MFIQFYTNKKTISLPYLGSDVLVSTSHSSSLSKDAVPNPPYSIVTNLNNSYKASMSTISINRINILI